MDHTAKTGDWKPVARWQFRSAMVAVAREVGERDWRGERTLGPGWHFMSNVDFTLESAPQKEDL